jgi:RNA polymerase sigma-70 factor (ECF subfamily)
MVMFASKAKRFEALVRAYSAELYRYGYWLCRDRFTAEDLVQETFARAWSAWSALRDDKAVRNWLYTILRNEHARLYERKRLDIADDFDLDSIEDRKLASVSPELEMREALHSLPENYREPLLLQVLGGFSCEEIARIMDTTPGAIMTRLSRARLALRRSAGRPRKESSA